MLNTTLFIKSIFIKLFSFISFKASIAQTICYNKIDMNLVITIITLFNSIGIIYLTYLFYKKNINFKNNYEKIAFPTRPYKINLVRYNPFGDLGGDQSFILCLLDNTNSGAIITSLHNRENTRVYAKAIKNGQSDNLALSAEETKVLIKTINN